MISFDKDFNVTISNVEYKSELSNTTNELVIKCGMNVILSQSDYQNYAYMIDGRPLKNKIREVSVAKLVISREMSLEYEFISNISYIDGNPLNCNFTNLNYSYQID